jgi:CRP-like cAMP-binding protein
VQNQSTSAEELGRCPIFAPLAPERLAELAERMTREEVEVGAVPVIERQQGDRFYIVLEGVLAVSNLGARERLRNLRQGDYFGELALIKDAPRAATVHALTPTTLASCDRPTFDEFVRPLFPSES